MLYCITSYFNPIGYTKIKNNYIKFRQNFKYPLVTVELAFDKQPFFIDDAIHIRGNSKNILWQKERLLNIAINNLPNNADSIAWIDADIIFYNDNWYKETLQLLENKPVCQLFEYVYEITPPHLHISNSVYGRKGLSFAKYYVDQINDKNDILPKPGLAWAMRKSCIPNGLYDKCIVGNNDVYQLIAWMGDWYHYLLNFMTKETCKDFLLSKYIDYEQVQANIAYVSGTIQHLYHGNINNRKYLERTHIAKQFNFNALTDIIINKEQIFEWSSDKPELHKAVLNYFYGRQDDR